MKRITHEDLARLAATAAGAARRRLNLNLHEQADDPIQRLFLVFQPATYVRPHCHRDRWELLVALNGRVRIPCFDDAGRVTDVLELGAETGLRAVELPAGTWHTVVALAADSTLLEVKHGPYLPTAEKDFATWAPAEGAAEAEGFERWARGCVAGESYAG